ncbi:MAG TPA: ATP-binding protein [Ottowia sp.]|nr:ATP-binding protein [Ottowia sp.]HMT64337.1 ATP-binding protein [Ottowia sp.]HPP96634.1 ATP-binding protein [Ottowia sp.]
MAAEEDESRHSTSIPAAGIDIESSGLLSPGTTVQDMQGGVSRILKPVIARVFRELHLVEQWGSGVRRFFAEAAAQGLSEPQVTVIATGVRLSVYLADEITVTPAVSESAIRPVMRTQQESRLESPLAARLVVLLHDQESGKAAPAHQALLEKSQA